MPRSNSVVSRYHDDTKHRFDRFARSLGYLDWASQPKPFRSFAGSRVVDLYPSPAAAPHSYIPPDLSYGELRAPREQAVPLCAESLGDWLRHAFGLSAWKHAGSSRWSLRVNPSSGNLHPTEAYIVSGPIERIGERAGVYHYAADRHAIEERCTFDRSAWATGEDTQDRVLLGLTSIHWREAWKYGERAFRYCQHDVGHAIGAAAFSAAALGWQTRLLDGWSHEDVAALLGLERDEDFVESEREEPACLLLVGPGRHESEVVHADRLVRAVRDGRWSGRASQLSEDHVQWTFIDEVAEATRIGEAGRAGTAGGAGRRGTTSESTAPIFADSPVLPNLPGLPAVPAPLRPPAFSPLPAQSGVPAPPTPSARHLFLQRRSAVAFDGQTRMRADTFFAMLSRLLPCDAPPWSAIGWEPRVHLVLFVHRVDDLAPGLYLFGRSDAGRERLLAALGRPFIVESAHPTLPLVRLAAGDCRGLARRLSCDQDIAADGCFSLGMLAEFDGALDLHGDAFYRNLFWEAGVIGQVLYLEAEAAGLRGTGIGCFYDDGVHDVLGLEGHVFQSLYHFTVGGPVEDRRVQAEPGYAWEDGRT